MEEWKDKLNENLQKKITNQAIDNIPGSENINELVETTQKTIKNTKVVVNGLQNIFNVVWQTIVFLTTTPPGWIINALALLFVLLVVMSDTIGHNTFGASCPIDPQTGVAHASEKGCEIFGDGSKKGRTSGKGGKKGSNSAGGTGEWAKNGTGSVPYGTWAAWLPDDLPDDVKEYALNPESVGMSFGSSEGWNVLASTGGQCTDLSASLMYAIWERDGEHPRMSNGHGIAVAGNWAAQFGGSTTNEPTAGAVFSSLGSSSAGHTGVVSHVFENGDFLIVEQNVPGWSGDENGTPFTWHYRIVTAAEIASEQYEFFDPSTVGFTLVSEAVSH